MLVKDLLKDLIDALGKGSIEMDDEVHIQLVSPDQSECEEVQANGMWVRRNRVLIVCEDYEGI